MVLVTQRLVWAFLPDSPRPSNTTSISKLQLSWLCGGEYIMSTGPGVIGGHDATHFDAWSPRCPTLDEVKVAIPNSEYATMTNNWGTTPLHLAAEKAPVEVLCHVATMAGTDIDSRDNGGYTPLHGASSSEAAQVLIAHGADWNVEDNFGRTPLIWACINESVHTVIQLLQLGATKSVVNKGGKTACDVALQCGYDQIVDLLEEPALEEDVVMQNIAGVQCPACGARLLS